MSSKKIGVDSRSGLIVEDAFPLSYLIWPTPKIVSARFVDSSGEEVAPHKLNVHNPYCVRCLVLNGACEFIPSRLDGENHRKEVF